MPGLEGSQSLRRASSIRRTFTAVKRKNVCLQVKFTVVSTLISCLPLPPPPRLDSNRYRLAIRCSYHSSILSEYLQESSASRSFFFWPGYPVTVHVTGVRDQTVISAFGKIFSRNRRFVRAACSSQFETTFALRDAKYSSKAENVERNIYRVFVSPSVVVAVSPFPRSLSGKENIFALYLAVNHVDHEATTERVSSMSSEE